MRDICIAGNWKMNMGPKEGKEFVTNLKDAISDATVRVVVAPPFVTIAAAVEGAKGSNIEVAAQNMADTLSGAFTGEVSAPMIKEAGATLVILGHSERRTLYHESDELINKKTLLALSENLEVILCVGETLAEREEGRLEEVLHTQITKGLANVSASQMAS